MKMRCILKSNNIEYKYEIDKSDSNIYNIEHLIRYDVKVRISKRGFETLFEIISEEEWIDITDEYEM